MKEQIWTAVYRRTDGTLWASAHFYATADNAKIHGLDLARRCDWFDEFVGVCDVSSAIERGFRLGMCHKADQVQPRLADLELRIAKAQDALGASAI